MTWHNALEATPPQGVKVIARYGSTMIIAEYIPPRAVEASPDDYDYPECYEYDEQHDKFWVTPGWYEHIDNWSDYTSVAVINGPVTDWHFLPEIVK